MPLAGIEMDSMIFKRNYLYWSEFW